MEIDEKGAEVRYDPLTPAQRSERMSRVRSKDSKAETSVRRLVHGMGFRYRLHRRDLPGCPDMVFPSRKKVIFVHGCFWHYHADCRQYRLPRTRTEFWMGKLQANQARDARNQERLRELGWGVLVVWECELRDSEELVHAIRDFLGE